MFWAIREKKNGTHVILYFKVQLVSVDFSNHENVTLQALMSESMLYPLQENTGIAD